MSRWSWTPITSRAECIEKTRAANIDRGDAEAGAEDRADGASARHIRSAGKILVGKREVFAGLQDEARGRRIGRILVVALYLSTIPFPMRGWWFGS